MRYMNPSPLLQCAIGVLAFSSHNARACTPPPTDLLVLSCPNAMVADKTLTLKAEILDPHGRIDWRLWAEDGTVTATRADNGSPVPTSIVVFDTHNGVPAPDSIHFYNGTGSVTITLDEGSAAPAGDITVTVSVGPLSASKTVTVLNNPPELVLSGTISGDNLIWEPGKGVIHLTGNCTVLATRTLSIAPGTLIMVDSGPPGDGTRVTVFGRVEALGTPEAPIFFFPTDGASAMHLQARCSETVYNPHAWRGFLHYGAHASAYSHVFVTGAGNAEPAGHTQSPIWHFAQTHSVEMNDCVFADNPGKAFYATGTLNPMYIIRNCLFTRCGHAVEFDGSGDYSMLVQDCYFTGVGHGEPACDRKGEAVNIRGDDVNNGGSKRVIGCLITDMKDDCIDEKSCRVTVENCIMYNNRDAGLTMEPYGGGRLTGTNLLIFQCGRAFSGRGVHVELTNCTILGMPSRPVTFLHPSCDASVVQKCVLSPGQIDCCGDVQYCVINRTQTAPCGAHNVFADPQLDPVTFSFDLPASLRNSGPQGEMVGWLGWFREPPLPPPPPTGACCLAGVCSTLTEGQCAGVGGNYQGDGSGCDAVTCPLPLGACCLADGSCIPATSADCASQAGAYRGDSTSCGSAACPQPTGACCFVDGSCTAATSGDCAILGGTYRGNNSACESAACPQPLGACCLADGSCLHADRSLCASRAGSYSGNFTDCASTACPSPLGACCLADGSCVSVSADLCVAAGGIYRGDRSDCGSVACPLPAGACCLPDGSCVSVPAADCSVLDGAFQGTLTECAAADCPQPCPADWNGVDGVDSQDIFDFFDGFFGGNADINGSDSTDSQDFFDFLEAFFAGCTP